MKKQKRPKLTLIGASGVLAGAVLIAGCDNDKPVQLERATYATQADCERDWSRADDCSFVIDTAQAASGASASSSAVGAHGSVVGARWYGPYYTRSGKVYHVNGEQTDEVVHVANSNGISESTAPESALAGHASKAISRGGFGESAHEGGGGEGEGSHGSHGGHGG